MKTILFARHAKSNWNEEGVDDFDRPLNEKGFLDAPKMAAYLQKCDYAVNKIISSDAKRALQTAEIYQQHLTPDIDILKKHNLYLASHLDIAAELQKHQDDLSMIMIVGHNPGMFDVVNYFTKDNIDDMPSCSVVIVQFEIKKWIDLTIESGTRLAFEYPNKTLN